jgi:hypothetical protein
VSKSRKFKALGIGLLLVLFGAALQGMSQASSGTTSDPTADSTGGTAPALDVTSVAHDDNGTNITWTITYAAPFSNTADFFTAQWDLDLSNVGTFGKASDACILLEQNGSGGLRASLKPGCGSSTAGTANATTAAAGSGESVTFSFGNQAFRSATGFGGTTYQYRVTSSDFRGNIDLVPGTGGTTGTFSGTITHSNVSAAATPTPVPTASPTPVPTAPPGSTTATSTQNQQVNVTGVLSISALQSLVDFASVSTGGSKTGVAAGQLDYTNTLNNGGDWNVTVKSTDLMKGTASIPYDNETFTPGTGFTSDVGSSGTPTAGSASQGHFVGTVHGAGNYSNPVTVATALGTANVYGSFHQTGDTLALNVPLAAKPGLYTGTLQYTITG